MNQEDQKTFLHKFKLSDNLAHIRTVLANERTFLSFQRTALAQFAGGASFIHFFEGTILKILGGFLIISASLTIYIGFWRYRKTKKQIEKYEKFAD